MATSVAIVALIFLAALLYSSVGHAGASAYLAVMAICGITPSVMRPSALTLNVLVATVALVQFRKAGAVRWSLVAPFALGSIPAALMGGMLTLPGPWYRVIVGTVLLYSASRLVGRPTDGVGLRPLPVLAPGIGMGIGLLSGLTGIGGGVLLGPLLIARRWADPRQAAGASAALNLANSLAGLAGDARGLRSLPPAFPSWALAAIVGGLIGSGLGARRLGGATLRRLLAAILVLAGVKLVLS